MPAPVFGSVSQQPVPKPLVPSEVPFSNDDQQHTEQMLIQAYTKLLDTIRVIRSGGIGVESSRSGPRVLVTVHGIGFHPEGYSNRWWEALSPHVGNVYGSGELEQGRQKVNWSDLVNQAREVLRSIGDDQKTQLRQSIMDVLEDRQIQAAASVASADQLPMGDFD